MKTINYVHYQHEKNDKNTRLIIDELKLDYEVAESDSLNNLDTKKCSLVVADHPPLKDNHYSEIEAFAKEHPEIPIIATRGLDFPDKLTRMSNRFPNVYFINKLCLVGGIEQKLG